MRSLDERSTGTSLTLDVERTGEPWRPPVLRDVPARVLNALTYVVLDDLDAEDGEVVVDLSAWPQLDQLGRVRHDLATTVEVDLPVRDLARLAAKAKGRAKRPPRIGDAFAMLLRSRSLEGLKAPVGPAVDVTVDARAAARAAFYGAVSTPLSEPELAAVEVTPFAPTKAVAAPAEWLAAVQAEVRA